MELFIDLQKKSALQKAISKSKKSVRFINALAVALSFIGLIGGVLYAMVNILSPDLSMVNVNGTLEKDVSFIIIMTSLIVTPCLVTALCLKVLGLNLSGVNNASRVDESLVVSDEGITYSFRNKHQTLPTDRIVISIRYADIESVIFEDATGLLKFTGTIMSEYFKNGSPSNSNSFNTFLICDYFAPSLKEILTLKGIDL